MYRVIPYHTKRQGPQFKGEGEKGGGLRERRLGMGESRERRGERGKSSSYATDLCDTVFQQF